MARRNVWRSRRRTVLTVGAMSLALAVLIGYAGLIEGYIADMERSIVGVEVGDVQVLAAEYRDNPSIETVIEDPEGVLRGLDAAGFPAAPRLLAFGLAAAGDSSAGASFRGVDLERDAKVSAVGTHVLAGRWLEAEDPKGVVVGKRLAHALGVGPGSELLVLSQGMFGSLAYQLFTVRGVLAAISDATDRSGVFMTAEAFRRLMDLEQGVHQIIVRRPPEVALEAAAARVRAIAPATDDVETWRQLSPTLASMLDSARSVVLVAFAIVYLAVAILILNAMLMSVFERVREFGVLKALGAGPFDVLRLIYLESALQAGLAIAIGLALGIPLLLYLARVGIDLAGLAGVSVIGMAMSATMRAEISAAVFAGPLATLVVMTFVAVLYPALKAAWIQPVEAMRQR
jgi:ABC-type lipoprotein release transport system permease subunit